MGNAWPWMKPLQFSRSSCQALWRTPPPNLSFIGPLTVNCQTSGR